MHQAEFLRASEDVTTITFALASDLNLEVAEQTRRVLHFAHHIAARDDERGRPAKRASDGTSTVT